MTPSLTEYCLGGIPGLVTIEYVLMKDVDPDSLFAIVNNEYRRPFEVVLLEGDWQTLPVLDRRAWEERQGSSDQGSSFVTSLQVQTRQLSAGASKVFDQLSRLKLLLRITDASGVKWIVGNQEQAFTLSYQRDAGGSGSLAGYNVSLSCETSHSMAEYLPA